MPRRLLTILCVALMLSACGSGSDGDDVAPGNTDVNGGDTGEGETGGEDTTGTDMTGGSGSDPLDAERSAFKEQLLARRGYVCQEAGSEDYPSFREVNIYTEDFLIIDQYFYLTEDCTGLPYNNYLPMDILSYTLGNKVETGDAREVWEIDFIQELTGQLNGEDVGDPEGTNSYDIIGINNGDVVYGDVDRIIYNVANRPTALLDEASDYIVIPPLGDPTMTAASVSGLWIFECANSAVNEQQEHTRTESTLNIRITLFTDDTCTTSWYVYEADYDVVYGIVEQGALGDYHLPVTNSVTRSEFTQQDTSGDAPQLPSIVEVGDTFYDVISVLDGNVSVIGDCLFFSPCGITPQSQQNIIDLFSEVRLVKQ